MENETELLKPKHTGWAGFPKVKPCTLCGVDYTALNPKSLYCLPCRKLKHREYDRTARDRKKLNGKVYKKEPKVNDSSYFSIVAKNAKREGKDPKAEIKKILKVRNLGFNFGSRESWTEVDIKIVGFLQKQGLMKTYNGRPIKMKAIRKKQPLE